MADDVWIGAEVRYRGPDLPGRLQEGVQGKVAELGGGRSWGMLRSGPRPRLGRDDVLVVLPDGEEVVVRVADLEVVTPPHPLRAEPDPAPAQWLLDAVRPWPPGEIPLPIACFVPDRYPEVVKVLHPWSWPGHGPATWQQVVDAAGLRSLQALSDTRASSGQAYVQGWEPPPMGRLDHRTARALVEVLAGATTTPDDVLVAVWYGWGAFPYGRFPTTAHLPTESRGHRLLRGPLTGVLEHVGDHPVDLETSGIWWPADKAWVVSTEVDFEWTFVAGDQPLIERLAAHPDLEVLHSDADAPANRLDQDRPL